jgi:hypothetical protein
MLNWLRRVLSVPERVVRLDPEHEARLAKLELERPAFVAELESMLEACTEILDRTEGKRGRIAAAESRRRRQESGEDTPLPVAGEDREQTKNKVRQLLRSQGKL